MAQICFKKCLGVNRFIIFKALSSKGAKTSEAMLQEHLCYAGLSFIADQKAFLHKCKKRNRRIFANTTKQTAKIFKTTIQCVSLKDFTTKHRTADMEKKSQV